ncbi:MAG: alpha/beta hydrolase [Bradyrhizobium sp.]|jgi:pimeloyl-ACP methyl ester carboxylesterase|uniref:Alpha/beta hydrolase n=4 Tax=Bradyrhizobium TaxID=374 RepID=A0ABS5G5C5_9BRAD|nr:MULTISPECIES: alpha/beta hydrolase [Bradyrhizobium]ABQ33870.1 putative alpha/beta hydrolase [Bradyrhizobium sp. BTAi1]MBR1136534.1 alpha/beta hydrolase [Bradyrhizobium denitrificans]MDU1494596.1 alpha/beta hydrolase [Bradyrhizobium sp.]MDU1547872.1 alpha/beta hydrolase [Bradyrhizobium sp.]MDU1691486.1 alpha/beta hydrolase [Bradyrhizobium sp.]
MISIAIVGAMGALALATRAGVAIVERRYPPQGQAIPVNGATINLVDIGPRDGQRPPLLLIHGASSNLEAMRRPLGDLLAQRHRVLLVDRPGHGWSPRERSEDSTPAAQARMLDEALARAGIGPVILVVHSWSGALGLRMALDFPERVAGLVMLAPVAYPWRGGVGQYNAAVTTPVVGPLLAHTITLPLGLALMASGARGVFAPQQMPDDFVDRTATPLLLRPQEFIANARDLVTLKQSVTEQAARYSEIRVPVTIVAGDADTTVSTAIHSRPLAQAISQTRLIVLPGLGHMVQNAVPDLVASEVERLVAAVAPAEAATP